MKYYFVIDTDEYAGNFERQVCAYITGQVGECEVGSEVAEKARNNIPSKMLEIFDEHVMREPDDHGCHRPCKIYPTPNFYNNGMGFSYITGEEDKAIEAYRKSCIEYSKKNVHLNDKVAFEKRWKDKANNAAKEFGRSPSYQSVAIAFYDEPDDDMIELMKLRAEDFARICKAGKAPDVGGSEFDKGFNILSFRLIEERVVTKEKKV